MAPCSIPEDYQRLESVAIVRGLIDVLVAHGKPLAVPRLAGDAGKGRKTQADVWNDVGGEIVARIATSINERRRAFNKAHGATLPEVHARSKVVSMLDKLAPGDDPAAFAELASRLGVELPETRRSERQSGLSSTSTSTSTSTSHGAFSAAGDATPTVTPCEPTTTRSTTAAAASYEARMAELRPLADVINAAGVQVAELGMLLSPDALAFIIAGHAHAAGSLEAVSSLLSMEHRRQLAPPPPPPPPPPVSIDTGTQTDEEPPAIVAAHAIAAMDDEQQLLSLVDTISGRFLGPDARDMACPRRAIIAMQRIRSFNAVAREDGRRQPDFVRSMLETFGADDEERLPLGHFLPLLIYYATRPCDDGHWQKTLNSKFNEDGGIYIEAWRDLKDHCGHGAINFLRSFLFSGTVKQGLCSRGQFDLSKLSLEERGKRTMLGGAVPSVRALNKGVKADDRIDGGGMTAPLKRGIDQLSKTIHTQLSSQTGVPLAPLSVEDLTAKLQAIGGPVFDAERARAAFHGDHPVRLSVPKKPRASEEAIEHEHEHEQQSWMHEPLPEPDETFRMPGLDE
jgi:hypothetical protein